MNPTSASEPIPLQGIEHLDSFEALVDLAVNGLTRSERTQGDLKGVMVVNGPASKVTVSGSLLGEIAAQIGGSIIGLFTPASVDLYKMPGSAYIVISEPFAMCIKPNAPKAIAVLDELSPESLLLLLTGSDVARGRLVGELTLHGRRVNHYIIDGDAFVQAARASADPRLRAFGEGLWSAGDADLFIDAVAGFPVAFQGAYRGVFEPLRFQGEFAVRIELTGVNTNKPVELPASCDAPIIL